MGRISVEPSLPLNPAQAPRRPVNRRSVLMGLLGVCLIAILTPFNNYALNNTDLVGCFLPTGVLLFIGAIVLLINPLLITFWPSKALQRGELAVILAMVMVACAFPAGGLMRYLPAELVGITSFSASNPDYQRLLEAMHLPSWLFPTFSTTSVQAHGNEEVIRGFVGRLPTEHGGFFEHFRNVPWSRWATPAATWGIFLLSLYAGIISMVCIFRRQWMENERLPFPIASVLSALVEPPETGKRINALFRSPLFWWVFGLVFALHAFNALNAYLPKWPAIPLKFSVAGIFANAPWNYMDEFAKKQTIYFSVIGMACLIESRLSFSLWFFFLLIQVGQMGYGTYQASIDDTMLNDQFFGGLLPYTFVALWVARHHLKYVFAQMFRGARGKGRNEPHGRYMPYATAGWVYLACLIIQIVWLILAGCAPAGAIVLVLMMAMIFFALTRMVAETGLLYVTFTMNLNSPWNYASRLPAFAQTRTNLAANFFGNLFTGVFTYDVRQSLPVYSSTAIAVADKEYEHNDRAKPALPFLLALVLAMVMSLSLSFASMLHVEYAYASSLDRMPLSPINDWGASGQPQWWTLQPSTQYIPPQNGPTPSHNRLGHVAFGAALTGLLSWGRLTWSGFPLHPLGYVLALSLGVRWVWFSILLGWLLKTSILKVGGPSLYRQMKPLALGLILAEAAAAAFWLVINVIFATLGWDYRMVQILLT